jgi:membrane associated rhomboid family serine protease
MRIQYNAPVVLTFAIICTMVLAINQFLISGFIPALFTVSPGMSWSNPLSYLRLVSHIAGHADWQHLLSNFTFILLLGPILEEKYGSSNLLLMMFLTGLATGIMQVTFFSEGLMGASGIVFMMIVLSSLTNFRSGRIPLTFILVALLFLGTEVTNSMRSDNISQFAHIIGGICGAIFGFMMRKKEPTTPQTRAW